MQNDRSLRRKILHLALLSFFSLVAALIIHFFSVQEKDLEEKQRKAFEEVLRLKEERLHKTLEMVLRDREVNLPPIYIYRELEPELFQEEGLTVYLYRNDSLIFWSNNNVPADNIYNGKLFSRSFINFGNGWFRIIVSEKGNEHV